MFISHASEDKGSFVRPLAEALANLGVRVWFDEFTLSLGDSLSRSIDKGLASSHYGVVVVSKAFIEKGWPEYELRGLVAREIAEDTVILSVWHGVSQSEVLEFSPPLADKLALDTSRNDSTEIALQILRVVRPDLYTGHPRSELERIAAGEALRTLQAEITQAREQLAEYQCPHCGAPLSERIGAPDDSGEHWGVRENFECGYVAYDGYVERPCPADPRFPKFEEFELEFFEAARGGWHCFAKPITPMARLLSLTHGHGTTREDAARAVRDDYQRQSRRPTK